MLAGLGTSTRITVEGAVREASRQALRRLGGRSPDAALVVATAAWGAAALGELPAAVADATGCEVSAGGSVDGLLAGEEWVAHRPALAVLALADVSVLALHAESLEGDEARVGGEWASALPDPRPGDVLVLFADALALAPTRLLESLAAAVPGLPIVGIGASEPPGGGPLVWAGDEAFSGACTGLLIRCTVPPAMAVTHGCRLLGGPYVVTRSRGHWVYGLAGRPALDVLRVTSPHESPRPASNGRLPLVGLLDPDPSDGPVDAPLVRNVVGVDETSGSFALPEPVRSGTRLVVLELERETAAREVGARVGAALSGASAGSSPAWGLYLTCRAAGDMLLAAAVEDPGLAQALAGRPLLGVSSAYQLAPSGSVGAPARLHTYSGVVALLG